MSNEQKYISTPEYKQIVEAGKEQGINFLVPKYNCKHCHGTGWVGKKDGVPLACNCILPKLSSSTINTGDFHYQPRNRAEKRAQMKHDLKFIADVKKNWIDK